MPLEIDLSESILFFDVFFLDRDNGAGTVSVLLPDQLIGTDCICSMADLEIVIDEINVQLQDSMPPKTAIAVEVSTECNDSEICKLTFAALAEGFTRVDINPISIEAYALGFWR